MEKGKNKKEEVVRVLKEKLSKLPVGFILGAAIGGGLYLYASKSKATKSVNVIINAAKMAAPYLIIAVLDRIVDNYETKHTGEVEDIEAEVS